MKARAGRRLRATLIAEVLVLLLGVRAAAADETAAAGAAGPKAAELLLELKSAPWQRRGRLELELASSSDPALLPALIGALADPDPSYRVSTARILGATGDPRAVDPLIGALGDPDLGVQGIAAEALGKLGDRRAEEPLARLIEAGVTRAGEHSGPDASPPGTAGPGHSDSLAPAIVAGAVLQSMMSPRGRDTLVRLLREGPPGRRRAAVIVIRNLYDPLIVAPLIDLLRSDDVEVRRAALDFLVWKRPLEPRTAEAMTPLLHDPDAQVRAAAEKTLRPLGAAPVGAPAVSLAPGRPGERPAGPAPPPAYLLLLRERIASAWAPPRAPDGAVATVALRVSQTGAAVNAEVTSGSGDPDFDRAALLALQRLTALPPLPSGRESLDLVVRFGGR